MQAVAAQLSGYAGKFRSLERITRGTPMCQRGGAATKT